MSARKQELSLNPQKLAGQCGKLKCCLNYELDVYEEARAEMPRTDIYLKTQQGDLRYVKTDVLRQLMWYAYLDSKQPGLIEVSMERVWEVQKMNAEGKIATHIHAEGYEEKDTKLSAYGDVAGQESLSRFDTKKGNRKPRKKRFNKNNNPKWKNNKNKKQ